MRRGCGGFRLLVGSANWHGELPSLAVLVSVRHLLHCPPAPIPGPGRQTCHYRKIRHMICLCLCVCVLIQAYLPCQLSFPLRCPLVLRLLVNLPETAALAAQSHSGCKWELKGMMVLCDKQPKKFHFYSHCACRIGVPVFFFLNTIYLFFFLSVVYPKGKIRFFLLE